MLTIPAALNPVDRDAQLPPITWEEAACPLCDHTYSKPILEASDPHQGLAGTRFCVVACDHCGMIFTNPRPDAASIGQFYPNQYRPHQRVNHQRQTLRKWYPLAALQGRPVRERRNLPMQGNGRLLDFGCGNGSFMMRMAEQGWDVTGLDASSEAVRNIRNQFGLRALQGTLPHSGLEANSFDAITMWHSLEHVHSPRDVLSEAHRLLVPNGRLILAVPNIESWPFRHFGSNWFGLDLPRHLSHFSMTTLTQMLNTTGYRVTESRYIRHSDWLRSSAKMAVRQGETSVMNRLMQSKPMARLMAWGNYLCRQSDCILAIAEKVDNAVSVRSAVPHAQPTPTRHTRDSLWFGTSQE